MTSDPFSLSLEGRQAIVCGSSAGIGLACAKALLRAGANVVVNGRNAENLERTQAELHCDHGDRVTGVVADVATAGGRMALLHTCPEPDILVCNSAGPSPGGFHQFDEADWEAALAAGMIAPISLIKAVVDGMATRAWGRIIAISSTAIRAPLPLLDLSNGVRSGFAGFLSGLTREVAPHGITVNAILPGMVETRRLDGYLGAIAEARSCRLAESREELLRTIPAGRFGKPEELGALCAFLASEPAAYLTGLNLLADGGMVPVR
jgi:3-oxoacyl-[acyl-carrier protein] reductase